MGRSGYSDDCENLWLWRGAVSRALKGTRGQQALREIAVALDAMPEKHLVAHSFSRKEGVCLLGALAKSRDVDVSDLEPPSRSDGYVEDVDRDIASARLNIAPAMVAEVMFMNDEGSWKAESPTERWTRMRGWVAEHIQVENHG